MPVGEVVLLAAAGCAMLAAALHHAVPGPLFERRFVWFLLAAQLVALAAYVASDLYRHSTPHDMARGWGRMVFLAFDLVAIAYLFGCARRNLVLLLIGQNLGALASVVLQGTLFGDLWKFGYGAPLTFFAFLLVPQAGRCAAVGVAFAFGAVHFLFDYRSYGAICLLAGTFTLLQTTTPRFRLWLAPVLAAATLAGLGWVYGETQDRGRTARSDIERTAMITAAVQAIRESPLIGHGSWFSNSDVYANFMQLRHAAAIEQRVGGFAHPDREPDTMALHSQILVALAEGGLFGGAFFLLFGAGLLWALTHTLFVQAWHPLALLHTLVLLSALWNLLFSPFSGAHRVAIATACGLLLLLLPSEPAGRASTKEAAS